MLVNNPLQCETERERKRLDREDWTLFVLSCSRTVSRIDVSAFDRDRESSTYYWALEGGGGPSQRWNPLEQCDLRGGRGRETERAAHSDVGKEIKKEGTPTTEGREKKREAKKLDVGRRTRHRGRRRTSRSLMGYPPRTSMQRHCR